ncbi:MAG: hypothetical protein KDD61_10305 [Bdellovibrionales bacterium]|nr:hypothetical protein [Bdellovibrionales bacterium]
MKTIFIVFLCWLLILSVACSPSGEDSTTTITEIPTYSSEKHKAFNQLMTLESELARFHCGFQTLKSKSYSFKCQVLPYPKSQNEQWPRIQQLKKAYASSIDDSLFPKPLSVAEKALVADRQQTATEKLEALNLYLSNNTEFADQLAVYNDHADLFSQAEASTGQIISGLPSTYCTLDPQTLISCPITELPSLESINSHIQFLEQVQSYAEGLKKQLQKLNQLPNKNFEVTVQVALLTEQLDRVTDAYQSAAETALQYAAYTDSNFSETLEAEIGKKISVEKNDTLTRITMGNVKNTLKQDVIEVRKYKTLLRRQQALILKSLKKWQELPVDGLIFSMTRTNILLPAKSDYQYHSQLSEHQAIVTVPLDFNESFVEELLEQLETHNYPQLYAHRSELVSQTTALIKGFSLYKVPSNVSQSLLTTEFSATAASQGAFKTLDEHISWLVRWQKFFEAIETYQWFDQKYPDAELRGSNYRFPQSLKIRFVPIQNLSPMGCDLLWLDIQIKNEILYVPFNEKCDIALIFVFPEEQLARRKYLMSVKDNEGLRRFDEMFEVARRPTPFTFEDGRTQP